ncbi:MAG TPA: hypothetical protein VFO60_07340 [Candidatus Dormibacteraeota bacterium]|nr:hypothetical protein [Candidatus Dormibacteraeota bacterium]
MDVWAWLEELRTSLLAAGQAEVVERIFALPGHALNIEVQQVEALVPELISFGRARGIPWLEVYARHWELQCRTSVRAEGEAALPAAVAAFERAHREDTRACPQTVCATQDLLCCYANVDGAGYTEERLAAAEEALDRIDSTWTCFPCMVDEKAKALVDGGRVEEAVAWVADADLRIAEAGRPREEQMVRCRARVLLDAGRPQEALDHLAVRRRPSGYEGSVVDLAMLRAEALGALGRFDESRAALPEFSRVLRYGQAHARYARTVRSLVVAGTLGAVPAGMELAALLRDRAGVGAHGHAAEVGVLAADLAVTRGARSHARWALDVATRSAARLRGGGRHASRLARLEEAIAAMPAPVVPVPLGDLPAHCARNPDLAVDHVLDWTEVALGERPRDPALAVLRSQALVLAQRPDEARDVLAGLVSGGSRDPAVLATLIEAYLRAGQPSEVEALAGVLDGGTPVLAAFARARVHAHHSRWRECMSECAAAVAIDPTLRNTRRLWAAAAGEVREWPVVLETLGWLVDSGDAVAADRWALVVAASALGDWGTVRSASAALGFDLPAGEGPVDARLGLCHVVPRGAGRSNPGETGLLTSPAVARILSVAPPGAPQRAGDIVVVAPNPLSPRPSDPAEAERWIPTFEEVVTLERGGMGSAAVFGPVPAVDDWRTLTARLRDGGWMVTTYTDTAATLADEERGPLPAVWACVAWPPAVTPGEAHALLEAGVAGWRDRPCWPVLAELAGADAAAHRAIARRYGMDTGEVDLG